MLKGVGAAGVAGSGLLGNASAASVGSGGYHDAPPAGATTHGYGRHTTANFGSGPVPTNDWYTTIPLAGITGENTLLAGHPLTFNTLEGGLAIGHPQEWTTSWNAGDQVGNAMKSGAAQLTVSHSGAGSYADVALDDHGDWSATGVFGEGTGTATTFTIAQGSPYAFFEFAGGGGEIAFSSTPAVFQDDGNVLGVTVDGKQFGIFAPSGSTWNGVGTDTITTGAGFCSIAVLPDQGSLSTFEDYAYNVITDTVFDWNYDQAGATVSTTFSFQLDERADSTASGTITALYPHQWKHTSEPTMGSSYPSARGEMKALSGSSFSVDYDWHGMIPFLPDEGSYDDARLEGLVSNVDESIQGGIDQDTYRFGKDTASRLAKSAAMADQLGMTGKRDALLDSVQQGLEEWFTQSSSATFYYDDSIGVLQGIPGSHGSVTDVSDHHFHFGHYVWGAARIARHDPTWADTSNWGGMVEELIDDYANPSRTDADYPFNRNFSVYAGHSWAHGSGNFADGNNQESSSEAMMAYAAMIEWGEYTGNDEIRDFGMALYATQARAIQEYWYDKDQTNFPDSWEADFAGIVWGNMAAHSTWWTADSEAVYGINMLPLSGYSMHLGWDDDLTARTFQQISDLKGGSFSYWPDILWMYEAFSDSTDALSRFNSRFSSYSPEAAQPKAHTLYWLGNLDAMGSPDPSVTADTALYQVFSDGTDRTYCAYNASDSSTTVTFSDGTTLSVPANSMATSTGSGGGGGAPSAPSNLRSTDQTKSSISLAWDHDGTNTAYYNVYVDGAFETTSSSTTATITGLSADTAYTFTVTADDGNGTQSPESNALTASTDPGDGGGGTGQQPYPGSPHAVPGRVQAQEYDTGGQGVAYNDTTSTNQGGAFRTGESVDVETVSDSTGGQYDVGWTADGEWLEYTVDVGTAGTYDVHVRNASNADGGTISIDAAGTDVTGAVSLSGTGGWQSWQTTTIQDVSLGAGEQVVRVNVDTGGFNLNWVEFEQVDGGSGGGSGGYSGDTGDGWSATVETVGTDQDEWTFEPNNAASWADVQFADPGTNGWVGYRMDGSGTSHTHTRDTSGDGSAIDVRFVWDDGAGGQYVSERRTHQY
ncbi:hypothetical protein GCM10028857_03640 [Salinarchaeum chitinilyticum]